MNKTFQTSQTGSNMKPALGSAASLVEETRNLKPEGFTFPASVQSDILHHICPLTSDIFL